MLKIVRLLFALQCVMMFSIENANGTEEVCELSNEYLEAMPTIEISLKRIDGSDFSAQAKLADNDLTRSAGFQRVCRETIENTLILFLFDRPMRPSFHMHNVLAPIDIAFIKKSHEVESIQSMLPYSVMLRSKPLYSPKSRVIAALEAREDYFSNNNIKPGSQIFWKPIK